MGAASGALAPWVGRAGRWRLGRRCMRLPGRCEPDIPPVGRAAMPNGNVARPMGFNVD